MTAKHRRRCLIALAALIGWAAGFGLLDQLIAPHPRLVLSDSDGMKPLLVTSDNQYLITSTGRVIQRWHLSTGSRDTFKAQKNPSERVYVAAGGQAFAYDSSDGTSFRCLSLVLGREVLSVPDGAVYAEFSPDGRWLGVKQAACVKIFESATGEEAVSVNNASTQPMVAPFVFSPDSRLVSVGRMLGSELQTQIWEIDTRRQHVALEGVHGSCAFSPDGKTLVDLVGDVPTLVDLATGRRLELRGHDDIVSVAFTGKGETVTAYTGQGNLFWSLKLATTWDRNTGRLLKRFEPPDLDTPCVDPTDSMTPPVVFTWDREKVYALDVTTGKHLGFCPHVPVRISSDHKTLVIHEPLEQPGCGIWQWIREHLLRWSPPAEDDSGWMTVSELATGRSLAKLDGYGPGICLFSPDSQTLVLQKDKTRIDVWDVPPPRPLWLILGWSAVPLLLLLAWCARRRTPFRKNVSY